MNDYVNFKICNERGSSAFEKKLQNLTMKGDAFGSAVSLEGDEGHGLWVVETSVVSLKLVGVVDSDHVAV